MRGPQVFREYWGRPSDTAAAFRDGWFRTGDEGCAGADGYHRILGRRNVDIVKTGGYKVSALEVEEAYRDHPAIRDVAVVGIPHPEWGEQLRAAWVPQEQEPGPRTGPRARARSGEPIGGRAPWPARHRGLQGLGQETAGPLQGPPPIPGRFRAAPQRHGQGAKDADPAHVGRMIEAILDNLRTYWIVHLLLLGYTVVLAHHAWSGNRRTRGVADYFVGGRSMGPIAIGLSFFATYSSTNSFVGFSGQAYDWGVTWFILVPFVIGMSLLAWMAVAPRLRTFTESLGSLTIPDFIGFRFGSPAARVMAAAIVLFASFFYMTAVFKGIGNLLEVFLDIPYRAAIIIVFFVVMLYTVVAASSRW